MLRETFSTELYTILLVLCLVLVAVVKLMFPKRFQDFALMLFNFRYLKIYSREQKFFDLFEGLLFANFIIGVSVFAILVYNEIINSFVDNPEILLFKFALAIGIFILIKVLVERIISSVLDLDFIVNDYLFEKISYKNFIGLSLIPINALILFSFVPNKTILLTVGILLIVTYSIGLVLFLKNNLNHIKRHFFYFILYLCALEISPYVILYKSFTKIQGN